jgi:GAF domain-containing protein/HAMP domain-containing protein
MKPVKISLPFWRRLGWNLILSFILLAILPVLIVTYVILDRTSKEATNQVYSQLDSVAELKNDQILRWLDEGDLAMTVFLSSSNLDQFIALAKTQAPSLQQQADVTAILVDIANASQYFKRLFIYNPSGRVIASSDPADVGKVVSDQPYFNVSLHADYIQSPLADATTDKVAMYILRPLRGGRIQSEGVLAGELNIDTLASIMIKRTGLGESGETYLVSLDNNYLLTPSRFTGYELAHAYHSDGIERALNGEKGRGTYDSYRNPPVAVLGSYRFIPELQAALLAEVEQSQALGAFKQVQLASVGVALLATLVALALGFLTTQRISRPIRALTLSAQRIGEGNLKAEIVGVRRQDELGMLARAFSQMQDELSALYSGLEQRVAERTTDLEISRQQSEKRARDLQIIGEISGIIASEQKTETLLPLVTHLVSERFDFYHVGIFLVDETGQWAVLQAANSEGGQSMLARGHKLEVGATGIVGYVTQNGTARIALDVGADSVFFNNPDLPATRSEMALPLNVRGQIIGALDVQSIRPGVFTEDDANTLGILADQIAIAIENTRLFGQIQSTLAEVQSLYRQDIATNWTKFAQDEGIVGYHKSLTESKLINQAVDTDEIRQTMNRGSVSVFNADRQRTESILVVPVKLREQVIGVLNIKASKNEHQWSFDEIGLAEAISERLALALENARLLQDSQNRAAKEQAISEITTKISGSINMRNILQTAVEELGHALPGSEVIIEFEQKNGNVE